MHHSSREVFPFRKCHHVPPLTQMWRNHSVSLRTQQYEGDWHWSRLWLRDLGRVLAIFLFYTTNQTAYSPERGAEPRAPRRPDFTGCRGPTRYSPLSHKHGLQYTHTRSMKTPWDGGISPEQSKQNSSDSILCITLREKTYIFRRNQASHLFPDVGFPRS